MPKKYEAIRDKMHSKGMPMAEAKSHAAAIFNSQRKPGQKPVTGPHKKKAKPKRRRPSGGLLNQGVPY